MLTKAYVEIVSMRGFWGKLNPTNGHKSTRLVSLDDWQRYFVQELKISTSVSQDLPRFLLKPEDYQQTYQHATQCAYPCAYDWSQLTLCHALLLLGNLEQFQHFIGQQPTSIFNKRLLNDAAKLSSLPIVRFLIEIKEIKPGHDTLSEATTSNTQDVVDYIARKTKLNPPLHAALIGHNFEVAAPLMASANAETKRMAYLTAANKDLIVLLRFLMEHDQGAHQYVVLATNAAYLKGSVLCLQYLVEKHHQMPSKDCRKSAPAANANAIIACLDKQSTQSKSEEPQTNGHSNPAAHP